MVQFDYQEMILHGNVMGIKDSITFKGNTPEEIKREFEISVDGYLDFCNELGEAPEKPYSGNIHLRLDVNLHAKLAIQAKMNGVSLNNYINEKLKG